MYVFFIFGDWRPDPARVALAGGILASLLALVFFGVLIAGGASPPVDCVQRRADLNDDCAYNSGDQLLGSFCYGFNPTPSGDPSLDATAAVCSPAILWTATPSPEPSSSPTGEPSPSATSSASPPPSPTPTFTATPTVVATNTITLPPSTATSTSSPTATPSFTATPTHTPVPTATNPPASRDKLRQPFASTSIWNMPIGSGAQFVDPGLAPADFDGLEIENALPIMAPSAPSRQLRNNGQWWPGTACNASGSSLNVPIPDGYVVPAPPSGGDGSFPNRIGGVLLSDGVTIVEFQYATRCSGTGPLTAGAVRCQHSIYASGVPSGSCYGAQGGSGLSGVGGVLRAHELTGTIPHALKITLPAEVLSNCNGGFRWPAIAADGYHDAQYHGASCALRMGSLVALPATYNCAQHAALGGRICAALRDYGAYVGDTHPNGFERVSIIGEWGTNIAISGAGAAIEAMADDLVVVNNNTSASVGGGGTPRVPLAPPISN